MSDLKFEICKAKDCNNEFVASNSKYPNACSQICFQSMKKVDIKLKSLKSIKTVSDKRKLEDFEYKVLREEFLSRPENKICPVTKWPTNEIHHKRKRRGFADEWARLNNVSLYLDTRFWLAVSREGHQWIEDNPAEAYELGYSIKNNRK